MLSGHEAFPKDKKDHHQAIGYAQRLDQRTCPFFYPFYGQLPDLPESDPGAWGIHMHAASPGERHDDLPAPNRIRLESQ